MVFTVTCHAWKNRFVSQVWISYPSISWMSPWQMNLGRTNQSSQCALPKDSLSLFLCIFCPMSHQGSQPESRPVLNRAEWGEKVLTSLQISGKPMPKESWEIATLRRNWNYQLKHRIIQLHKSPGSFKIFREKDDFRHTVFKTGTFLFHVALSHGFASDNAVITE